ncbi:MAG: NUDIX hydrolase [Sphingobacteriia bacterium]|nr:NUDIX hydrolase [Sphingobacteriia bacterium]
MKYKPLLFLILNILISACSINNKPGVSNKKIVLTTAAIIEVCKNKQPKGIVLIERGKEPWGYALPGGKVEYGETVEHAIRREMKEEVNLELYNLKLIGVHSEPSRDPRHHSVEVTYQATAFNNPTAGDDAAKAFIVTHDQIPWGKFAFDHEMIVKNYLLKRDIKKICD